MNTAETYALYFMKRKLDKEPNTFAGNMKLQKLLVFADLISMAETCLPLFTENIYAFENGYVVEDIRKLYRNNYAELKRKSDDLIPDFSIGEFKILATTEIVYGSLSPMQLSRLSHQYAFWLDAYNNGLTASGYRNKEMSIISNESMQKEIEDVRSYISQHPLKEREVEEMSNLEENYRKLNEFTKLQPNWDGYGGVPIDNDLIILVSNLLTDLMVQPELFPTGRGTIQLNYGSLQRGSDYIEFEVFSEDRVEIYSRNKNNQESEETIGTKDINERLFSFS